MVANPPPPPGYGYPSDPNRKPGAWAHHSNGYPLSPYPTNGYSQHPSFAAHGAPPPKPAKKPLFKRWWFWPIALLAIVIVGSQMSGGGQAPSESPAQAPVASQAAAPPAPEPATQAKIGSTVTVGDLAIRVDSVQRTTTLRNPLGNKKGSWLVVNMTIKNNGKTQVTVNDSQFTLIEADGTTYETDSDNIMYVDSDKNLTYKSLNPKMTTKGVVLFAVPPDTKNVQLEASAGLFGPSTKIPLNN